MLPGLSLLGGDAVTVSLNDNVSFIFPRMVGRAVPGRFSPRTASEPSVRRCPFVAAWPASHGGIYLNAKGRRTFFQQYELRLTREFTSEHAGHRSTLRQQLRDAAAQLKSALKDPGAFRPFRVN